MSKISTARESLARLNARIEALTDPRQRAWLSTHRDHWWAEVIGDVDAVMATMSHGPIRYTFDGHPFMAAEGMSEVKTYEDTRRMYQGVTDFGIKMAGPADDERILFDDDGLCVACILTAIYPGVFLTKYDPSLKADSVYLLRWPNVTFIKFDSDGLMMGEDIINGAPLIVREVPREAADTLIDGPVAQV